MPCRSLRVARRRSRLLPVRARLADATETALEGGSLVRGLQLDDTRSRHLAPRRRRGHRRCHRRRPRSSERPERPERAGHAGRLRRPRPSPRRPALFATRRPRCRRRRRRSSWVRESTVSSDPPFFGHPPWRARSPVRAGTALGGEPVAGRLPGNRGEAGQSTRGPTGPTAWGGSPPKASSPSPLLLRRQGAASSMTRSTDPEASPEPGDGGCAQRLDRRLFGPAAGD